MLILDWEQGVRRRETRKGEWRHFPCPSCRDSSAHLGVRIGVLTGTLIRCLRCGYGKGADIEIRNAPRMPQAQRSPDGGGCSSAPAKDVLRASWGGSLPMSELHLGSVFRDVLMEHVSRHWPRISWEEIADRGGRYLPGDDAALVFPFRTLRNTNPKQGYQIRRFTREPKVLTRGPGGPATFLQTNLRMLLPKVIVEGWMDGVAVPPGYQAVFLLGLPDRETASLLPRTGDLFLALDNDEAGQMAMRRLGIRILREGRTYYATRLGSVEIHIDSKGDPAFHSRRIWAESWKDPAEAGGRAMFDVLGTARERGKVTKLAEVPETFFPRYA